MTGTQHGDKRGRPRRYDFTVSEDYADDSVGYAMSVLDELLERVVDQIDDLPAEAFGFRSPGVWFSLGWLPLHLAVSEYNQINKVARALTGESLNIDETLSERLRYGALHADGTVPEELRDAATMVEAMRRVRRDVTAPYCRTVSNPDSELPGEESLSTPRNVLMHLMWHWTFHSGHIGLLRLEWGSDYEWTMAQKPAT